MWTQFREWEECQSHTAATLVTDRWRVATVQRGELGSGGGVGTTMDGDDGEGTMGGDDGVPEYLQDYELEPENKVEALENLYEFSVEMKQKLAIAINDLLGMGWDIQVDQVSRNSGAGRKSLE